MSNNKSKIADILYDEICYAYCDNCRFHSEIGEDNELWACDNCYRKYNYWGISRAEAEKIAELILR